MYAATMDIYDCGMRKSCDEGMFCAQGGAALANQITSQMVERASSAFGRLVLLSSLCDRCAGAYHHPSLDSVVPSCLASLVLRRNHEQAFAKWLELIIEEQWKEISEYLGGPEAGEVVGSKTPEEFGEALIPEGAREPERELFLSDLGLILSLLKN
jgi:hypothetical protein